MTNDVPLTEPLHKLSHLDEWRPSLRKPVKSNHASMNVPRPCLNAHLMRQLCIFDTITFDATDHKQTIKHQDGGQREVILLHIQLSRSRHESAEASMRGLIGCF